ncbi:MAG: ATP phosphoribosyltransferase, partial [Gammaproteobacteria bacterium]|nr:ATP phosphoribosyltransferase [Gammaproteobacteria bacterium]
MIDKRTRIKIAIQKSGRLTDHSLDLLERCGLKYTRGRDQLIGYGENMPVDLLFVRDDDIPGLVRDDVCDLGIAGLNIIEEKRLEFVSEGITKPYIEVCRLDYGHCRLAFGYPETGSIQTIQDLKGSTIATSYPFILR